MMYQLSKALEEAQKALPYLRIGQIIDNACCETSVFYVEDERLVKLINEFVAEHATKE